MDNAWAVQDAKARFSEVMRAAEKEPQHITRNGEEKAVLVSATQYRKLTGAKAKRPTKTLLEALRACPYEIEIPPRSKERGRSVEL